MGGFEQVAWFPLCAGLTAIGLVASWFAWRRRGAASGMRLAAWSLLPLAAYLMGIVPVLWDVGTRIATWAAEVIISPLVWAGIALAGLAIVGFVVSGALRRRSAGRSSGEPGDAGAREDTSTREITRSSGRPRGSPATTSGSSSDEDEDLSDVEEILRRRGIS